jgi:hypothetical protein
VNGKGLFIDEFWWHAEKRWERQNGVEAFDAFSF